MLKNWFKIYFHQIKNNKFFTTLNVLGLSIGISGLIFAILYWNDEHSYDEWNPESENIFQVINYVGDNMYWATNISPLEPFIKEMPEVKSHCYLNTWYLKESLEYNGKKEKIEKIIDAQSNFFSFFPYEFVHGNATVALQDNKSIALSEETAKLFFGNKNPIGKQITYKENLLTVKAVYRFLGKSSFAPMAVISLIGDKLKQDADHWGNFSFGLFLNLENPADASKVKKKIEQIYYVNRTNKDAEEEGLTVAEYEEKYGKTVVYLESLKSVRLHSIANGSPEGKGNYQFLMIMMGLSLLILVMSVMNYVNLATANTIKRAKEVGVRKILGASKKNIILQFLFETILTATLSILIALVIVELALPFYNQFLSKELVIHSNQFYKQLMLIFIIVILFAGIFPAIYVSNFETLKVLKGNFGRSKSGIWLRNGMLVLQFAIASFFIIGSSIVYQQVRFMNTKDLGFSGDQIINVNYAPPPYDFQDKNFDQKLRAKHNQIREELLNIKTISKVASGGFSFSNGSFSSSSFVYNNINIQGQNMSVDFDILELMQIKLSEGRYLSEKISSDTISSILINETALKQMKEKNPIGKIIDWNGSKLEIIGVIKDFHVNGPQEEIPPMVFFHYKTIDWTIGNMNTFFIKSNPEKMQETLASIEKLWKTKVNPENPFQYDFVDKAFARTYENYVKQKNLFSLLNLIVILIALFGLFALASYSIQRRMKEIAIRKTLGAETKTLLKELSKQYVIFCLIGFLIALFPVYFLLGKWLENFAYRIEISLIPFIIGFFSLMILTLIVVLSRAYQATRVNVLKYLKYE